MADRSFTTGARLVADSAVATRVGRRLDRLGANPPLFPCAIRGSINSATGPGRHRAAIFAGDDPYSTLVWVSLRTHARAGDAIRKATKAVPDVRRGFERLEVRRAG